MLLSRARLDTPEIVSINIFLWMSHWHGCAHHSTAARLNMSYSAQSRRWDHININKIECKLPVWCELKHPAQFSTYNNCDALENRSFYDHIVPCHPLDNHCCKQYLWCISSAAWTHDTQLIPIVNKLQFALPPQTTSRSVVQVKNTNDCHCGNLKIYYDVLWGFLGWGCRNSCAILTWQDEWRRNADTDFLSGDGHMGRWDYFTRRRFEENEKRERRRHKGRAVLF